MKPDCMPKVSGGHRTREYRGQPSSEDGGDSRFGRDPLLRGQAKTSAD